MPAETTQLTWPTAAELDDVEEPLAQVAENMVAIYCRMQEIDHAVDHLAEGLEPTAAEMGQLSAFIARIEHSVSNIEGYLETIRKVRDFAASGGFRDAS